jgi:hypothetical protein
MAFNQGDVVVRKRKGRTVVRNSAPLSTEIKGRICRVVTPGLSYMVAYEGFDFCLLQFERSLVLSKEPGPACPPHATC